MEFVTLDFETATSSGDSPCEIGLTFVRDGIVQNTYSRLIRPPGNYYDYWNTKVHGIKPNETEFAPSFDEVWSEICPLVQDKFLVAHNAAFDFSVLRRVLGHYRLDVPPIMYACSVQLSKKAWPHLEKYNLKALCNYHGIPLRHHRAEADSLATAQVCIKAFNEADVESVNDIRTKLTTNVWQMQAHGNVRLGLQKKQNTASGPRALSTLVSRLNPTNLFYGKKVVVTGELSTMKRNEALQEILDIGGFPEETVTEKTDFLIVGKNVHRQTGATLISGKQRAALRFITQGANIRFLSEPEFIYQLQGGEVL